MLERAEVRDRDKERQNSSCGSSMEFLRWKKSWGGSLLEMTMLGKNAKCKHYWLVSQVELDVDERCIDWLLLNPSGCKLFIIIYDRMDIRILVSMHADKNKNNWGWVKWNSEMLHKETHYIILMIEAHRENSSKIDPNKKLAEPEDNTRWNREFGI